MTNLNSRWRKSAQRYSDKRTVEYAHWVRDLYGGLHHVRKMVTEILFVQMQHEPYGWRNGARIRKV